MTEKGANSGAGILASPNTLLSTADRERGGDRKRNRKGDRRGGPSSSSPLPDLDRVVVPILSAERTSFIDLFAARVAECGETFEETIRGRESPTNPSLRFLFGPWNDPEVLYYRWRVYSLLQGDKIDAWRTQPYRMTYESNRLWIPPPALEEGFLCQQVEVEKVSPVASAAFEEDELMNDDSESSVEAPQQGSDVPQRKVRDLACTVAVLMTSRHGGGKHSQLYRSLPKEEREEWLWRLRKAGSLSAQSVGSAMAFALQRPEYCYDLLVCLVEESVNMKESPSTSPVVHGGSMKSEGEKAFDARPPPPTSEDILKENFLLAKRRVGLLSVWHDLLHNIRTSRNLLDRHHSSPATTDIHQRAVAFKEAMDLLLKNLVEGIVYTLYHFQRRENRDKVIPPFLPVKKNASLSGRGGGVKERGGGGGGGGGAGSDEFVAEESERADAHARSLFPAKLDPSTPSGLLLSWTTYYLDAWTRSTSGSGDGRIALSTKAVNDAKALLGLLGGTASS